MPCSVTYPEVVHRPRTAYRLPFQCGCADPCRCAVPPFRPVWPACACCTSCADKRTKDALALLRTCKENIQQQQVQHKQFARAMFRADAD